MSPFTKRTARRAPGGFVESEKQANRKSSRDHAGEQARGFVVEIIVFQKMRIWGRYETIAAAQRDAAKLREHHFDSVVRVAP